MIKAEGLTKRFDGNLAVDDLTLNVERGEVYRHWWLSSGSALVFATFRSATLRGDDAQQARSAAPDAIIDSLARAEET